MSKKILNSIASDKTNKITLTQRIESTEKQWIISRSMKQNLPLVEGCFLSSSFDNGFSIGGGNSNELMDKTVVSVASAALIITILLQGELHFAYDDLTFDLNASEQALGVAVNLTKPANFKRNIVQSNHVKKLHLMFTPEWIRTRLGSHCSMAEFTQQHKNNATFTITPSIFQLVATIISSRSPTDFSESIKLEAMSYALFSEIIEILIQRQGVQSHLAKPHTPSISQGQVNSLKHKNKKTQKTIEDIVSYIEAHLNQRLSLEKIAENFSMSASNLQRIFKQELSLTVSSYIRYRRLEIAKYNLQQGLMGVTEAAYEAGYHHPANFTHAFKKIFGYPPTTFVKN